VIARVWRGVTRAEDAEEYARYVEASGLKAARAIPGNRGTLVLRRVDGDRAEFETIAEDEVMARFSDIILSERPYLAPMKDCLAIPYALEDASFVASLKGVCIPDPPFGAGVTVQAMVESAYESARTGRAIEIGN